MSGLVCFSPWNILHFQLINICFLGAVQLNSLYIFAFHLRCWIFSFSYTYLSIRLISMSILHLLFYFQIDIPTTCDDSSHTLKWHYLLNNFSYPFQFKLFHYWILLNNVLFWSWLDRSLRFIDVSDCVYSILFFVLIFLGNIFYSRNQV